MAPFADKRSLPVARRLGLSAKATGLAGLVSAQDLPRLVAALTRCGLTKDEAAVRRAAHARTVCAAPRS